MVALIERLVEVIDDLATLDVDTLTDEELHHVTVALQRQRARLGAAAAACLARWDTRGVWSSDQSRSAGGATGP